VAAAIDIQTYSDVLVVLGTAGVVVPLAKRWGLSPVLGYLAAGAVLGPLGLGSLIAQFPFLYWITVVDAHNVASIGELGVVFLLFLIGMELSYERLKTMRRLVFGLGGLQVLLSTVAISAVAALAGLAPGVAVIVGGCLALSSTAIVIEVLSAQGRLSAGSGRASFAVLLAQDLAVIPLLLFVTILAGGAHGSVLMSLAYALFNAAVAVGGIVLVGRLAFRPIFRLVASVGTGELFVATTLFIIIGTGVAAALAGMSMALGAFVAGLLLAETEFRKAIESTIGPFKGLLLGLFFFSIGMNMDLREVLAEPLWLIGAVIALIGVKTAILTGLGRYFRLSWPAALEAALPLGPGGEFAFVGIGMASALGLIGAEASSFILTVTSITMALIPALAYLGRRLAVKLPEPKPLDPELLVRPEVTSQGEAGHDHSIVIGYGRVGQVVCAMLEEHKLPYIAVDNDMRAVPAHRRNGSSLYYGDASDPVFLEACGLHEAKAVIVTVSVAKQIDAIVAHVRRLRPDVLIVSRAKDAAHAEHLYAIGVSNAVPETIEASLQLSEAALLGLGQAAGRVIASIHDKRDVFRKQLQEAALGRV
jgi:CPA2 family monovalent cation:H+ antiporter-2